MTSREQLLEWNHRFPCDRYIRKKYNIPLFSPQHLDMNQLDITMEYLEDRMFDEFQEQANSQIQRDKEYQKGILLHVVEEKDTTDSDELFDNLDLSKLNTNQNKEIEEE